MNIRKTFIIFLVLLCIASVGIASVGAASDVASDDEIQSAIDDNAMDEFILEETDNSVSDAMESPMGGAADSPMGIAISGAVESTVNDSESGIDSLSGTNEDKSLDSSILKDGETIIYVSQTGDDAKDGLTEENAVATVSKAYEIASDGSTINIGAGTYTVNGISVSKSITIKANEAGTTILDGDASKIFTIDANVILINLTLTNGATTGNGGLITVKSGNTLTAYNSTFKDTIMATSSTKGAAIYSSGNVSIYGSEFKNLFSRQGAALWQDTTGTSVIIDNTAFDNVNGTYDGAIIKLNGPSAISRSNFTNIHGAPTSGEYGNIYSTSGNLTVAGCNFINMTGPQGAAIYFTSSSGSVLNVTGSVFDNISCLSKGVIYSTKESYINYNIFTNVNQGVNIPSSSLGNGNIDYNYWGTNDKPDTILAPSYAYTYWVIAELSTIGEFVNMGENPEIGIKLIATDGEITLDGAMDGYSFDLSASSGNIEPGTISISNNEASAIYTPAEEGTVTVTANPGNFEWAFTVRDPAKMLVVSNDGSDETGAGTLDNPYATIAHALGQVTETRNVIYLLRSESAYKEHDIAVSGNVVIKGEDKTVTIDAENAGRIFIVTGTATIEDLTLVNGHSSENGGAIYIDTSSDVSVSSVSFASNTAAKGEAIYIENGALTLSGNTMTELETIYIAGGSVNSHLTFLPNGTIEGEIGETLTLNAALTDDNGNVIRGGSVIFTADGVNVGTADLSGDNPLEVTYIVPAGVEEDIVISGSYSFDADGTVVSGTLHPKIPHWFIEGGGRYEFLSQAVEAAQDGDVIYGLPGIYAVNGITISKDLTIKANEPGAIVLDGNKDKMFTVASDATLTLINLTFVNGGTSGGGFITINGAGKVNIEGCRFENSTSSSSAAVLLATGDGCEIIIKDSNFDNINCTTDYTLMQIAGNLRMERCNFTNINGMYAYNWYGAIGLTSYANGSISECQFINITGGDGSSIYFNSKGNLNVTRSVFVNNKNHRGAIFLNNPSSANINYNLFIGNEANMTYAKDVFISSGTDIDASYNFWGVNSQPSKNEITKVEKAPYWTIVKLSSSSNDAYLGIDSTIELKFVGTNGVENISLDDAMPEYSFDLSASSGSIEPGTITIEDNVAIATYTPAEEGTVTITSSPGSAELVLKVMDPAKMLVVSGDGSDETGAGTLDNPYATIAHALGQVTETRNVVYILRSESAYKEHGLTISGNVIIQGEDETVTIDGESSGCIFIVTGVARIEHLTLINGQSSGNGGAIYVNGGSLNLTNANIHGSNAANGGAIYIDTESDVAISSVSFASNTAAKGEAIYIENGAVTLSGNTMTELETIYIAGGSVNSHLTFLDNKTLSAELGETITLTATLTDDNGNVIRGGSVIFTADGITVDTVDLSGDSPLEVTYIVPIDAGGDIVISGSYTLDNGGTVVSGTVHPFIPHWFIEGGRGYEFLYQAVEAANDGDVIYGEPGTYTVNGITISKNITIKANETGTIVLDGNKSGMFTVNSPASLTLLNLVLCNGGTSDAGGFVSVLGDSTFNLINSTVKNLKTSTAGGVVYLDSNGKVNIEGCHIENISSSSAAIIHAIRVNQGSGEKQTIAIRDSSFNNINNTYSWGADAVIEINGNLIIERSNFTNILGTTGAWGIGAIGASFASNYFISECQFINITGGKGSAIYFYNNGNITVTKSVFMNNRAKEGVIYLNNPASANINYNLFIDNEAMADNPRDIYLALGSANADYNYWGTNDPSSLNANIILNNWVIMAVSPNATDCCIGDTVEISIDFKHTNNTEGEIGDLGDTLPIEFTVYASTADGIVSPAEVTIVDSEAKLLFTPLLKGENTVTIACGSETIDAVITAAYKTSSHLQQLIDSTPEGGALNLSNVKFENVSCINITKAISIVGDNASISTAGDGNPVFSIASDAGNVSISGIEFVAGNGATIVKATAANGTDDLSIVSPAIELANNTVTPANDDVVASSITLLELEAERGVLAPSNLISIKDNALPEGAKAFDFTVAGLSNGSDVSIPQGGNINTNSTTPVVKAATAITAKNMKTTTVNTKINGNNAGKNFSITLKDSNGNALAGKEVLISLNGKVYKVKTDAKGIASVKVALSKKGTYPVVVSFLGDDKCNGSFAVAKVTVSPQKVKLTVAKKKYKASKKKKVLTATLKATNKKAIKGKKLVFTVNGKKYTAKTNAKGIAKVKVKLSKRKTYRFTVKFAGDNTFKKISKKGKVVIK